MKNGTKYGFTLIELMLVMGIMGLMGTLSVGGYRAMRRGMEERGTMQNVNQFIRNAYQRAMIDRQPTAVYFWNETRRLESDDGSSSQLVVGHAVAVRRAGRVSYVDKQNGCLVDEFGDLRFMAGTDEDGEDEEEQESRDGSKAYLYKVNGNENTFKRWRASQATMRADAQSVRPMMTDVEWANKNAGAEVQVYGYYLDGGVSDWKVGDAYGFEFADMTLPNNYIFETTYSTSLSSPIAEVSKVLRFSPTSGAGGQTITVSAFRPDKSGALKAKSIGTTVTADSAISQQNK